MENCSTKTSLRQPYQKKRDFSIPQITFQAWCLQTSSISLAPLNVSDGVRLLTLPSMASRSSVDATRFTATEPHAYSQSTSVRSSAVSASTPRTSPLSQTPSDTSGPNNKPLDSHAPPPQSRIETPKEKLERLRAARFAQRGEQLTTWERTVIRGRVWADRIHRITATSLILFGGKAISIALSPRRSSLLANPQNLPAYDAVS